MKSNDPPAAPSTFVVVGGGTSAILLTIRLLESNQNVILLERGAKQGYSSSSCTGTFYTDPANWPAAAHRSASRHSSMPLSTLGNRTILFPQGALGLGGTSNINAMIWSAGHRSVYDRHWPSPWSSAAVDSLLRSAVSILEPRVVEATPLARLLLGQHPCRGADVADSPEDPLYFESAKFSGRCAHFATVSRTTGKRLDLGLLLRSSTGEGKGTLTVLPHCEARRIEFEVSADGTRRATAVRCNTTDSPELQAYLAKEGSKSTAGGKDSRQELDVRPSGENGEIVLCAGVFESPRILLDSPGLDGVAAAKEIGAQLQDHICLPIMGFYNWWAPRKRGDSVQYPMNCIHGWVYLDAEGEALAPGSTELPCVQLLVVDGRCSPAYMLPEIALPRFSAGENAGVLSRGCIFFYACLLRPFLATVMFLLLLLPPFRAAAGCVFGVLVSNVQPHSRGKLVRGAGNSPLEIHCNFLGDKDGHDKRESNPNPTSTPNPTI